MATTCGYLCPACEGRTIDEEGNPCHWCTVEEPTSSKLPTDEEWINKTHEGPCCAGEEE